MKTCTCLTYWERMAKKLARQHLKLIKDTEGSGATLASVVRSTETATKILKGHP